MVVSEVVGHGKLTSPASRGGVGYDEGPVSGPSGVDFVCRNGAAGIPAVTLTPGTATQLSWNFGAAHVGDCALFLSYDVTADRAVQQYFKIANFPDCNLDSGKVVSVMVPNWLKAGRAVMRWDWYALHVYPKVEFYSQCVDVTVGGSGTTLPAAVTTYTIAGQYPADGSSGRYWNPYNPPVQWKMVGPPCAPGITGNCCTAGYARTGYIKSTCASTGSTPPAPAPSVSVPVTPTAAGSVPTPWVGVSECETYVVKTGDTLAAIAEKITTSGFTVTWQNLCMFNQQGITTDLSACNVIDVGDNLVIPTSDMKGCKTNSLYAAPSTAATSYTAPPTAAASPAHQPTPYIPFGVVVSSCALFDIFAALLCQLY